MLILSYLPVSVLFVLFNVQHIRADCDDIPGSFLPFGSGAGDTTIAAADVNYDNYNYTIEFTMFGIEWEPPYTTRVTIGTEGWLKIEEVTPSYVYNDITIQPRELGSPTAAEKALRVGDIHLRHSTEQADIDRIDSLTCGVFDGALVVTYDCIGLTAASPRSSYQLVVAHGAGSTILIINYGSPRVTASRYVTKDSYYTYQLNDTDIADDGLLVANITGWLADGETLNVYPSGPCPACADPPDSFLPFGPNTPDESFGANEMVTRDFLTFHYFMPFNVLGIVTSYVHVIFLQNGAFQLSAIGGASSGAIEGLSIYPMQLDINPRRAGTVYIRHSTDYYDMYKLDTMTPCGPFDGALIVTYMCIGNTPLSQRSNYQVVFAYREGKTILLTNYGSFEAGRERFVQNFQNGEEHVLGDGITALEIVAEDTFYTGSESFIALDSESCPPASHICEVHVEGFIDTLNEGIANQKLSGSKNVVASVDKMEQDSNDDPCKFFLMIHADDLLPTNYIRIGVGVHTVNDKKYLRKFQFSADGKVVKEFGQGFKPSKILTSADMPYSMNDTGSVIPLGITVNATPTFDGWVITSATCGYTFTYRPHYDPLVIMKLEGPRYDNRIMNTCGEMGDE